MMGYRSSGILKELADETGFGVWGGQSRLAAKLAVNRTSLNRWLSGYELISTTKVRAVLNGPWSDAQRERLRTALRADYSEALGFLLAPEPPPVLSVCVHSPALLELDTLARQARDYGEAIKRAKHAIRALLSEDAEEKEKEKDADRSPSKRASGDGAA